MEPCGETQRERAREPFKQEEIRAIVNLKGRASVRDVGTECGPAGVASGHPAPRPREAKRSVT